MPGTVPNAYLQCSLHNHQWRRNYYLHLIDEETAVPDLKVAHYLSITKRQRCVLNLRASPGPQCTNLGRDLLRTKVRAQRLPLPLARNVFPTTQEGKQWCSFHFRAQETEPQRGLVKGQCFNSRTWAVCYYRIAERDLARAPKRRRGIGGTPKVGSSDQGRASS